MLSTLVLCMLGLLSYYLWDFYGLGIRNRRVWEGIIGNYNYRDVGGSINECLGSPIFATKRLSRANFKFSGWSCEDIGNPDEIYSFNFDPMRREVYHCVKPDGSILNGHFQNRNLRLHAIEDLENWLDQDFTETVCNQLYGILFDLSKDQHVLIHCEAGRDRTGAIAALLAMAAAEQAQMFNEDLISAIECDYRKTMNLSESQHGRMRAFAHSLIGKGGPSNFLIEQCKFSKNLLAEALVNFSK